MNPKADKVTTVIADKVVEQGRRTKATLYVHAGIAAADAICAAALGKHAKGHSHQDAVALLASVDKQASRSLGALLEMKTRAGYGHDPINITQLSHAERAARTLVEKATR